MVNRTASVPRPAVRFASANAHLNLSATARSVMLRQPLHKGVEGKLGTVPTGAVRFEQKALQYVPEAPTVQQPFKLGLLGIQLKLQNEGN